VSESAWVIAWVVAALAAWVGLCAGVRWLMDNPREDLETGLVVRGMALYARLVHRLRVEGRRHVPTQRRPGPLIVMANHTAGVDPLLIQSVCPFEIRWMMAEDMRTPSLEWFWKFARIIFVDRLGRRDLYATREAIRHLREGGVLGIFPEGGLERPPGQIMPFQKGIGLILAKTGAPILPVVIDGTPQVDPAWASLWRRSRSRVRFGEIIPVESLGDDPKTYAGALRDRFAGWVGWPKNEDPPPFPESLVPPGEGPREVAPA